MKMPFGKFFINYLPACRSVFSGVAVRNAYFLINHVCLLHLHLFTSKSDDVPTFCCKKEISKSVNIDHYSAQILLAAKL